ncbi:autophagy-related protein 8A-like [Pyrus ussuriensis x Pyrus communis]|uniref:Autophagy-related protein 8A-like n=1 Tax=Pyrus ussuriensis x Pyrus communis TaxID=2448454 RepID=A0A5N5G2H9_9ROSA|nr:autophagy-related protein 8A-like [Pyrus ussuriensis x Pyrus communis]
MGMRKQNLNQKGEVIVVCLLRKATLVEQPNKIDLLLSISISQRGASLHCHFAVYNESRGSLEEEQEQEQENEKIAATMEFSTRYNGIMKEVSSYSKNEDKALMVPLILTLETSFLALSSSPVNFSVYG